MTSVHRRVALIGLGTLAASATAFAKDKPRAAAFDTPPQGFASAMAAVNGTQLHYVKGGQGPAVILLHGFPEDWTEYRAILERLGKRFTVIAVDLPGVGKSKPATGGYDAANLAAHINALRDSLKLEKAYLVGHDLGGIVAYAYLRRFPDTLRGTMILDVPIPGVDGWDESSVGLWHVGFIQAPNNMAEKLVSGRQAAFLGWALDFGKFTPQQRAYYYKAYGDAQLHAAFEIYRGFPKDIEWNAAQTSAIAVPVVSAVGEKSFFTKLQPKFVEGFRAKGIATVESAQIPGASHYVVADNPDGVAEVIEKYAAA